MRLTELSLTGRMCYLFMCIERYLSGCYPNKDWSPVAKRCWQWTNRYWNEGRDIYLPVVPEYLFEYDNYEKTNLLNFEGILSETDYLILKELFSDITKGNSNDEINQVLKLPIEFNDECECTDYCEADKPTLSILGKMEQFLSLHKIDCPDIGEIAYMSVNDKNGWGNFIESESLSIII